MDFNEDTTCTCSHQVSDVVVVGSIILDLSVFTDVLPKPGETVQGKRFILGYGGKGANQAIMAKLLGATVTLVGKVGNDAFGVDYIQGLKSRNISTSHIFVTDEAATGVAQITVDGHGQNSIIVVPGANMLLTDHDVARSAFSIRSAKTLLCQLEVNLTAIHYALKTAFAKGVFTMLNTAPIPADFSLQSDVFDYVHLVCSNESEASQLANMPACNTEEHARQCAALIQQRSATIKWVLITLGGQGVYALDCENRHGILIPTIQVDVVDTTGAGDAFMGALAYFFAANPSLPMHEMIRRSSYIASGSVTRAGTQSSYLPRTDLDSWLFV